MKGEGVNELTGAMGPAGQGVLSGRKEPLRHGGGWKGGRKGGRIGRADWEGGRKGGRAGGREGGREGVQLVVSGSESRMGCTCRGEYTTVHWWRAKGEGCEGEG